MVEKKEIVCSLHKNLDFCTCTYEPCSRMGKCCECIDYHRSLQQLPGCLFPREAEKTYDRSISKFLSCYK